MRGVAPSRFARAHSGYSSSDITMRAWQISLGAQRSVPRAFHLTSEPRADCARRADADMSRLDAVSHRGDTRYRGHERGTSPLMRKTADRMEFAHKLVMIDNGHVH